LLARPWLALVHPSRSVSWQKHVGSFATYALYISILDAILDLCGFPEYAVAQRRRPKITISRGGGTSAHHGGAEMEFKVQITLEAGNQFVPGWLCPSLQVGSQHLRPCASPSP
jgi:hypothetical protein